MARLLLVVVLALGVFVMHTVGHPTDDSGSGSRSGSSMSARGHAQSPGLHAAAVADSDRADAAGPQAASSDEPDTGITGTDLTELCLAVLGAWALAALLHAAFTRRPDWPTDLRAGAVAVLRPAPPPRTPDLTELSVLRT